MTEQPKPDVLNAPMGENDAGAETIRGYLVELIQVVWDCREDFNAFGNSGWDHELHRALFEAGLIEGETDEDGWPETLDRDAGDALIQQAIRALKEQP